MALRLNDWVECGELLNTRSYSTHGWIKLKGIETPLVVELTGNMSPDLRGWHFRFEAKPPEHPDAMKTRGEIDGTEGLTKKNLEQIATQQVGATGDMTASRNVRTFDCTIDEFLMRCKAGEPPVTKWKRLLYLEWYSQNGRVVIELADPVLEFVQYIGPDGKPRAKAPPKPEPIPPCDDAGRPLDSGGFSASITSIDAQGNEHVEHVTSEDLEEASERDLYGLVPPDLQSHLDAQTREMDRAVGAAGDDEDPDRLMRETELMDDLLEHDEGQVLKDLLPGNPRIYNPDKLSDKRAEAELMGLLTVMALIGVAFDVCEHCSPREAYRILVREVLEKERGFGKLAGTNWVQHYATSDYCPACKAKYEAEPQEGPQKGEEGSEA